MKDKFLITVRCQGEPIYIKCEDLNDALMIFYDEYTSKNAYNTMNFTLEVGTWTANRIWEDV